jgi:hypothetical protein
LLVGLERTALLVRHIVQWRAMSAPAHGARSSAAMRVPPLVTIEVLRRARAAGVVAAAPGGRAPVAPPAKAATEPALAVSIVRRLQRVEIDPRRGPVEPAKAAGAWAAPAALLPGDAALPLAPPAMPVMAGSVPDPVLVRSPRETEAGRAAFAESPNQPIVASVSPDGRRGTVAPLAPRTVAIPDQEIERLAERVIGTIDRRIAAQRERLGRA